MQDAGFRRYLPFSLDFDTRAEQLALNIDETWNDESKRQIEDAQRRFKEGLLFEYGVANGDQKIRDFVDIGRLPFSMISYHNAFHRQARSAFVCGAYYPALTSVCSLGERILNHLIIDLRGFYTDKFSFRKIRSKKSFDNWDAAIDALVDWGVLLDDVASSFRNLKALRNSAIHFNIGTYTTYRQDALSALGCMRNIVERQFGSFGNQPWMIPGTRGHCFIKKEYEADPFVKIYYLPQCPFVGIRFAMRITQNPPIYFDVASYGNGNLSDEQFKDGFNARNADDLVNPDVGRWKPLASAKVLIPNNS